MSKSGNEFPLLLDFCPKIDVTTKCIYNLCVNFEWDEGKRLSNIKKHDIDFAGVENLFDGETVTVFDNRFDYDEKRFITFGLLEGRIVAHTETDTTIRIISVRKATTNEEENYFKTIGN